MSKSNRLAFDQIREVFHIVQEAIDLGNDPVRWRGHMLQRMCGLIEALWGVSFLMPMRFDPTNVKPPLVVLSTMPREKLRIIAEAFRSADVNDDPLTPVIARLAHKPITRRRRELVDDRTWYNSGAYKRWREPMGDDDMIHSHDPLPEFGVSSVLGFVRAFGDKPFTPRDAKIVDLLRAELHYRWIEARKDDRLQPRKLTLRHQQLLSHLRGPMSEKQIAAQMGLSVHTVHNYVKELYRRLKVTSRAELTQQARTARTTILPKIGFGDQ